MVPGNNGMSALREEKEATFEYQVVLFNSHNSHFCRRRNGSSTWFNNVSSHVTNKWCRSQIEHRSLCPAPLPTAACSKAALSSPPVLELNYEQDGVRAACVSEAIFLHGRGMLLTVQHVKLEWRLEHDWFCKGPGG